MYKKFAFEVYLRFNTKEKQKTGTLHNQLIPLEHITLGTLDVWINLVENELHSHLHHLVVILHLKEDLQLIDDAGYVASRSRSAPFEVDFLEVDVAVPDLCTFLPVIPRWEGVGHVPVGEADPVSVWDLNQPQVSACLGSL